MLVCHCLHIMRSPLRNVNSPIDNLCYVWLTSPHGGTKATEGCTIRSEGCDSSCTPNEAAKPERAC